MDYRTGKCSQCGAEYKVPASFAHNVARCKVCKGVVHLGAPGGPAPATPPAGAAAASGASVPAKKVVPKPAAPRAARPPVPEAKKTPPSAPARPAAASTPAETARAKGGTLERLKSERRAPAPGAGAAADAPAKPAAVAAGARGAARSEDGDARSRRGERTERRAPRKEKKPPVAGILSGVALVLIGAGLFLFKDQIFGGDPEAAGTAEVAATPGAGDAAAPAPGAPSTGADAAGAGAADTAREPSGEEPPADGDVPPADAAAAEAPKPKGKDPASVDLTAIPDFEPTPDTSAEEWAQMNEWMATWMDLDSGAAGNRARLAMIEKGRKAVPVILNHFKTLDFATSDGRRAGDLCQKALMQICNGTNFDWKYVDEAAGRPVDHPDDVYFCKRVVELWSNSWKQAAENIEAWIKIAKLDEKDPEEAQRLREQFGGAQPAVEPPSGGGDDDLEVD